MLGFDCRSCKELNLCEGRGCIKGIKSKAPYLYNGEKIWECPLTFYNEEIGQAMVLYGAYEKGFLPDSGGVLDQSARFLNYTEIIGDQMRSQQEEESRKARRKMNK